MSTTVLPVELTTIASASPSESPAQESPMHTALTAVRTLVMTFLILAGSLMAVFASPAQDAAAAGPCSMTSQVLWGTSQGSYYVNGYGAASCNWAGTQFLSVYLYQDGVNIAVKSTSGTTNKLWATTNGFWVRCGSSYRVAVTHHFNSYTSTTWSNPIRLC